MKTLVTSIFLLGLFAACEDDVLAPQDLLGEWEVYERGYSPGAGYIVEEASGSLTFGADGDFRANYPEFEGFQSYRVLEIDSMQVLALYESRRVKDNDDYDRSYTIHREGDGIKLWYRWCFEGCHVGIRRP